VAEFCTIASEALPVDVLRGVNTEADDLIAGVVQRETKIHKRIVSTDRDFLQLIGPKTDVYAPVKKIIIDESNFDDVAAPKTSSGKAITFPRERYLDYRALTGDPSDNLPGVSGMGPLSAAKLLRRAPLDSYFGNATAVRDALERKSLAVEQAFRDGTAQQIVERNRMLMDLRRPAPCWDVLDTLTTRGAWRCDRFEAWYRDEKITAVEESPLFARLEALAASR
jgi:DNA polymerase-1